MAVPRAIRQPTAKNNNNSQVFLASTANNKIIPNSSNIIAADKNPEGGDKFREIADAYEHIGDEGKRKEYDNRLNNPFANIGGGMSHEDLINQMFGNRGGNPFGNQQRRKSAPDKVVKVTISPVDSYLGSQKTIQYIKDNQCSGCGGSGGEQQVCTGCNGMGFHIKSVGTGFMTQQFRTACGGCGGRGYTLVHRCYSCSGNGVKPTTNQINIEIKSYIHNI